MVENNITKFICEAGTVSDAAYTEVFAESKRRTYLRVVVVGSGAVYVRVGADTDGNPGAYVSGSCPFAIQSRCTGPVNIISASGDVQFNAVQGLD